MSRAHARGRILQRRPNAETNKKQCSRQLGMQSPLTRNIKQADNLTDVILTYIKIWVRTFFRISEWVTPRGGHEGGEVRGERCDNRPDTALPRGAPPKSDLPYSPVYKSHPSVRRTPTFALIFLYDTISKIL